MPIFTKDQSRVYFAHIPKTAGIAVYIAFIEGGWQIANVTSRDFPGSTLNILKDRFGIETIPLTGRRFRYRGPLQHAPASVWRFWGRFDDRFAVVRHPVAKLRSSLRYQHQMFHSDKDLGRFVRQTLDGLRADTSRTRSTFGGHFRRQSDFITAKTHIFKFEEDWQDALCAHFGLPAGSLPQVNVSRKDPIDLTPSDLDWIAQFYARDFAKFGYAPGDTA